MTSRYKYLLAFLVIAIIGLAGYDAFRAEPVATRESPDPFPIPARIYIGEQPMFTWKYRSFEKNDMLYTEISIIATSAEGGPAITRKVDTIEGSCNSYETPDADVYPKSDMIICYYAGLGHYYKVVNQGGKFLVQRKEFEEASPDYNPPIQSFEAIAEF